MVERTTSGSLKPGRAGFRLVAAVSNTDLARLAKVRRPLQVLLICCAGAGVGTLPLPLIEGSLHSGRSTGCSSYLAAAVGQPPEAPGREP